MKGVPAEECRRTGGHDWEYSQEECSSCGSYLCYMECMRVDCEVKDWTCNG